MSISCMKDKVMNPFRECGEFDEKSLWKCTAGVDGQPRQFKRNVLTLNPTIPMDF